MESSTLLVLMWKHLMVRVKRWLHTPVELISPLMFFLIVFAFKGPLSNFNKNTNDTLTVGLTDTLNLSTVSPPLRILYSPSSEYADTLMDVVGAKLRLNRTSNVLAHRHRGYYGFTNKTEMDGFLINKVDSDVVVIFENMDGDALPEQLKYTIRMGKSKDFFPNSENYSPDDVEERHQQFGLVYEKFMRLQWTIDTSYIKILTGNEVTQDVWVQEFPYYRSSVNHDLVEFKIHLIFFMCYLSLFIVFVSLMARLLEERASGVQELTKMVGVSNELLGVSHFLNVLPSGLIYSVGVTILLMISPYPLSLLSSGFLIFLTLLLHFTSVVAMAFAFSYIITNTTYIVSLSVMVYVGSWIPTRFSWRGPLTGLLPHKPLEWFWMNVLQMEKHGLPLTLSEVNKKLVSDCGSVLWAYVCCVVQIAFFFSLSWYLSRVRPGAYGQALPWTFLFQRQYWSKNEVKPKLTEDEEELPVSEDAKYFQPPPKDMEAGIKIQNVTKVFPRHKALNNVSMDVYKGEITVLVGHNGAGKTTLMSIITGMMSPSSGRVLVHGVDASLEQASVRRHLGLCPQHNLFFPDLTVTEHVMFFTLLKGDPFSEARAKSRDLLASLDLSSKGSDRPTQLSGGMKRRLQLACALAGDASVLVLDEPTSGLDVETRKGLWDLLLSLRGSRTVLLTTHFMEEADALGDRVAALHHGKLRSHATPMYLKKAIGTGYRLNFTTASFPKEEAITSAITGHIPEAALKDKTIKSVTYNLPAASSGKFPALFETLEQHKQELGIETIGVGVSTLDDVFMKLCSDVDTTFTEDEVDSAAPVSILGKSTGFMLYLRQFWYLMMRQFYYVMDKKISFLVLQLIVPILVICVFTATLTTKLTVDDGARLSSIDIDLGLYSARPDRRVLCQIDLGNFNMRTFNDQYPGVTFVESDNITEVVLRAGEMTPSEYGKYLAGLEINETDVKILYTTVTRHAAPVALNLATNILASRSSFDTTFKTSLHPLDSTEVSRADDDIFHPKPLSLVITWAALLVFVILSTVVNFVTLPCKERMDGTRHIHIMSGCPVALHWLATCLFHIGLVFVSLIVPAAFACYFLDHDEAFKAPDFIGAMMLTLFLGSLAFLSFMYWVSFMMAQRGASILLIGSLVLFGLVTTLTSLAKQILAVLDETDTDEQSSFIDYVLKVALYTMPPQAVTLAMVKNAHIAGNNAACELNKDHCPFINYVNMGFDTVKCCAGEKMGCYMCKEGYAPWQELVILTCQFVTFMALVMLTETGLFTFLREKSIGFVSRLNTSLRKHNDGEGHVRAEALYVEKQIDLPHKQLTESNNAMLINDLHKNYVRIIGKNVHAVKGISLSVKKGECFGLLGVNGAGKSTTFKMLTAEEWPSAGQIYANGHFRKDFPLTPEHFKYLRSLGYCPQFSGVDSFMSGRANLELLLVLRGYHQTDLEREVDYWIQVVGLERYSGRKVSGYSGGCARRLAAAAALCAGARVALLDEPTSGVDVAARRRVWAALRRGLARGQAIIISSHSMEEIEALCARIAIMSAGGVRVVGTAGELRALYAGHAVLIKLLQTGDEVDGATTRNVNQLKDTMQSKFKCTLKDEHKSVLHYHITDTLRYSEIFSALENLRENYPNLIEDYSVTETTLEEVFISIAKEEQNARQAANNIV